MRAYTLLQIIITDSDLGLMQDVPYQIQSCFEEMKIRLTPYLRNILRLSVNMQQDEDNDFDIWVHKIMLANVKDYNKL